MTLAMERGRRGSRSSAPKPPSGLGWISKDSAPPLPSAVFAAPRAGGGAAGRSEPQQRPVHNPSAKWPDLSRPADILQKFERMKDEPIGCGTFGRIWLVRDRESDEILVMKEIFADDDAAMVDAINEATIHSQMSHEFVIRYRTFFRTQTRVYLVMEFATGGDLLSIIKKHRYGYVHRDIKSANIMLSEDNVVRLGDFGLARHLEPNGKDVGERTCATPCGTPMYNAPERQERGVYTQKVDIWALGCVAYELCALKPAFDADSMESLKLNISGASYDPLPATFSQELRDIIDSMLSIEPEFRPSASHLLRRAYLAQYTAKAMSESPTKGTKLPLRRRSSKTHASVVIEEDEEDEYGGGGGGGDEEHVVPSRQEVHAPPPRRGSKQLERLSPPPETAAHYSRSPSPEPRLHPWPEHADGYAAGGRVPSHGARRYSLQPSVGSSSAMAAPAPMPSRMSRDRRTSLGALESHSSVPNFQEEARLQRRSSGTQGSGPSRSRSQPSFPVGQLRKLPPLPQP